MDPVGWFILIFLAIASAATGVLFAVVLWLKMMPEGEDNGCGRCGYPVRGLTGMTCPECGADFREAAIQPFDKGRPWRIAASVSMGISVTFLLFTVTAFLTLSG